MPIQPRGGPRRPHPNRSALLTAILGLVLAAAAAGPSPAAAEGEPPVAPGTETPAVTTVRPVQLPAADSLPAAPPGAEPGEGSPRPPRRLSPMGAELAQALEAERTALRELQARFDRAPNEREALAVQREIERVKTATEIALLRIQAKHARLKGRETVARRIEDAIEAILHPPVIRDPAIRPVRVEAGGGH